MLERLKSRMRTRTTRVRLDVWHSPDYRLPLPGLEARIELRRAAFALWALLERRVLSPVRTHAPQRISYPSMARVHDRGYLESLTLPATLGRIFAVDPSELVVDELMGAVRQAFGEAAKRARLHQVWEKSPPFSTAKARLILTEWSVERSVYTRHRGFNGMDLPRTLSFNRRMEIVGAAMLKKSLTSLFFSAIP